MSNSRNNIEAEVTASRTVLSQLEELQKAQKAIEAAMGKDPMTEYVKHQKTIEAAMGNNVFNKIDKIQKAISSPTGQNAFRQNVQSGFVNSARENPKAEKNISSVSDLGTVVRQKRKNMGLSQQQLADMANIGRRFISELESGKPTLEFGRVLKVCQSIGIDLTAVAR